MDRQALPVPDFARLDLKEAFIAPRTPVEQQIADIWADVLDLEQIGIHDNFFELGGHSLLATRVISRLRKTFQIEMPLRILFETLTVATLAEAVEMLRMNTQSPDMAPGYTEKRREKGRL